MNYAEVAVNSPLAQPRTFSYSIPPNIAISVGHAVWVPFGPRLVQGIVLALSDHPSVEDTKEIAQAIGPQPILLPHQIELCRWIAEHYLSSYFEAAAPMLPPGFGRRVITFVQPAPNLSEDAISSLTAQQQKLLTILQTRIELGKLQKIAGREKIEAVIGHEKTEGKLGWNQLRGLLGDKVNALMAAIGYNLRLILKVLSILRQILKELFADLMNNNHQTDNLILA